MVFLDVAAQEALRYQTTALLPFESYTRKAVGYLFAIGVRGLLNKIRHIAVVANAVLRGTVHFMFENHCTFKVRIALKILFTLNVGPIGLILK